MLQINDKTHIIAHCIFHLLMKNIHYNIYNISNMYECIIGIQIINFDFD